MKAKPTSVMYPPQYRFCSRRSVQFASATKKHTKIAAYILNLTRSKILSFKISNSQREVLFSKHWARLNSVAKSEEIVCKKETYHEQHNWSDWSSFKRRGLSNLWAHFCLSGCRLLHTDCSSGSRWKLAGLLRYTRKQKPSEQSYKPLPVLLGSLGSSHSDLGDAIRHRVNLSTIRLETWKNTVHNVPYSFSHYCAHIDFDPFSHRRGSV